MKSISIYKDSTTTTPITTVSNIKEARQWMHDNKLLGEIPEYDWSFKTLTTKMSEVGHRVERTNDPVSSSTTKSSPDKKKSEQKKDNLITSWEVRVFGSVIPFTSETTLRDYLSCDGAVDSSKVDVYNQAELNAFAKEHFEDLELDINSYAPTKAKAKRKPKSSKIGFITETNIEDAARAGYLPTLKEDSFYVPEEINRQVLLALMASKNILLTGHSGTGKTELAMIYAKKLGYDCTVYDMSGMDDFTEALLGKREIIDGQTKYVPSRFSEDIAKKQVVILDEISRAPVDANNILFPLLDNRKKLINPHHKDVDVQCIFIATANEGSAYTGTSMLDAALRQRFRVINVGFPPQAQISKLLLNRYDIDKAHADKLAQIHTSLQKVSSDGLVSSTLSIRPLLEASADIEHGESFEAAVNYHVKSFYQEDEQSLVMDNIKTIL